jgi:serine/threonine protein kinase/formylglycine-generating enzyme required for sulfatase activity
LRKSPSDLTAAAPDIPDHEMIRQIGMGSYGEVWLGRSVTGVLRAVKVVRRANFELERTFEREFEGIKSFEPISRKHPGLVNILHIGRKKEQGFYYYVMELADDRISGRDIVPELYVPHTLSSEINEKVRLAMDRCAGWGAVMAGALDHMHKSDLMHRDVKPSNIIFVDGVPKLADIGLVAASGQRSFVGTEGFVPLEGPGEPAADIYSLGMVLYEMSSGEDRLEFPGFTSVPEDSSEHRKWKSLNEIVLKACAPLARHRYGNAREMRQALQRLGSGVRNPLSFTAKFFRVVLFSGILAVMLVAGRNHDLITAYFAAGKVVQLTLSGGLGPMKAPESPPVKIPVTISQPPSEKFGTIKIISIPPGAKVFRIIDGGESVFRGYTSPDYVEAKVPPGEVEFELVLDGYRNKSNRGLVRVGETLLLGGRLEFYQPPVTGKTWENSRGITFDFIDGRYVGARPFSPQEFEEFLQDRAELADYHRADVIVEGELKLHQTVLVNRQLAREFFDWLAKTEQESGYLNEDQHYVLDEGIPHKKSNVAYGEDRLEARFALFSSVQKVNFATLVVSSNPPQAGVYINDEYLGRTRIEIPHRHPGSLEVVIRLAGFRQQLRTVELQPGGTHQLAVKLREDNSVVFNREWSNGMGMKLLPLGEGVMMAAWETRVKDFDAFCAANGIKPAHRPPFKQGPHHPVVKVSRKDAGAFCQWLSKEERAAELINTNHEYRLPTDREWSIAAGLEKEKGSAPWQRDSSVKGVFPWGKQWPPPAGSANIADRAARQWLKEEGRVLPGFDDKFAWTAPVGSFKPSAKGYFDLAGNVWEWVIDPYGGRENNKYKDWWVARGGGYDAAGKDLFLSSYRNLQPPDTRATTIGFRIVLAIQGITLKD